MARRVGRRLMLVACIWSSLASDNQLLRGCGDSRSVAVADVDKDGFDDVVVMPCKQTGVVYVAYGDKANKFARRQVVGQVPFARSVAAGELKGEMSIVVGSSLPHLHVYRRKSTRWGVEVVPSLEMSNDVHIADMNNDKRPEIVSVAQKANAVEIHHWGTTHDKKGWQTHRGAMPTREQGFKPKFLHAIVIARLKANATKRNKPQVLLLSTVHKSNCRDASIMTSTPSTRRRLDGVPLGVSLRSIRLSNRIPPVVVAKPTARKKGESGIHPVERRGRLGARDACAADIDGDGALDLVVAYKFIDAVLWYRNLGGAEEIKFGPPQDVCKSGTCKYACGVDCADFNGDGRVDVVAVSRDAPHMSIFFNRGNAHELGAPTTSHGGFRRVDAPFLSPQTGACAAAAFAPRRNASSFSVAYAARHSSVSFGVVTLPRTS